MTRTTPLAERREGPAPNVNSPAATASAFFTLAALTLFLATVGCQEPPPPVEEVIRPVRIAVVQEPQTERTRLFTGTSKAGTESRLSFKVSGTLKTIAVKVGDKVEPEALIAELDASDYELQVQEAKASLAQSRAQARSAAAAYKRTRRLYESRSASKADLDAARAQSDSARAQIAALSKRVKSAQSTVEDTRLVAPAAGVIAQVPVEPNENVQPTQTVVVLAGEGAPEVVVSVPAAYVRKVAKGAEVPVRFPELGDREYPGTVSEIGEQAQDLAGTYPVTIRLKGAGPEVRSGMAARTEFVFEDSGDEVAVTVPSSAVAEDRQGRYVYLVVEGPGDGLVKTQRREVEVGELSSTGFRVKRGVKAGDRVVTAGVSRIRDGQVVRLLPQAPEKTARTPAAPATTDEKPAPAAGAGKATDEEAGR